MKGVRFRVVHLLSSTLGLALGLSGLSSVAAAGEARNVPHWVNAAARVDTAADSQRVTFEAFLGLRNQSALKNLVAAQTQPTNAQFGKYLTPEEFRAQFAPKPSDVKRVQNELQKLGFRVEQTPASGIFVQASGTIAQIKATFAVTQDLYSYHGKILRANAETPRIPAAIADVVKFVAGLDESGALRTPKHIRADDNAADRNSADSRVAVAAARTSSPDAPPPVAANLPSGVCSNYWGDKSATMSTAAAPYPATLPWLVCGYTPQQLRAAYGADEVSQDGSGVKVGIVDAFASPTIEQDANRYSKNHGLPRLTGRNFHQILQPGILDVPPGGQCDPQGWYGEETLDVEAVHSIAPGASIVYASNLNCTDLANLALYDLIDNHRVDIVTNSYGYTGESGFPDGFFDYENQYFLQAAAEGMSILFSSGDNGDVAAAQGYASGSWDATSPYVTAVGGTSLALLDHSGNKQEWGWGTYRVSMTGVSVSSDGKTIATTGPALPFSYYAGAGGGPSILESAPWYQSAVPYQLSGYTTVLDGTVVPITAIPGLFPGYFTQANGVSVARVTPDIAMDADPYTGFAYGETYTIAGDPVSDAGCSPISSTLEYCEGSIGGTSLASPLFAGVLALVNQARFQHHLGPVGFANPALYALAHGEDDGSGPIVDVRKPRTPKAVLRGYLGNPNKLRVVTMNSVPNPNYVPGKDDQPAVLEGVNTSYLTTSGFDETTGLGTPYVPALIRALTRF